MEVGRTLSTTLYTLGNYEKTIDEIVKRKEQMNLDELTLGDIKKLQNLLNKDSTTIEQKTVVSGDWKIVILQRGWIYVGKYFQYGHECRLENAYNIRNWGTTKGLGELAECGPTSSTKLDKSPTVSFHALTIIATIDCKEEKWKSL